MMISIQARAWPINGRVGLTILEPSFFTTTIVMKSYDSKIYVILHSPTARAIKL